MENFFNNQLEKIELLINEGLDTEKMITVLNLIGISNYPKEALTEIKLYNEFLPAVIDSPLSLEQRYLHFLWSIFDKSHLSICSSFAISFKKLIAKKVFNKCGSNFICENNVDFNIGHNIKIGNNVFLNRGVYIDSKGGVEIGNSVAITEDVKIFTHTHSETDHTIREYKSVLIKDFAKIYSGATILPGVTIGKHSIVAAGALVTKDVPDNYVVGGIPAKKIRKRNTEGRSEEELNHIWLGEGAFQKA